MVDSMFPIPSLADDTFQISDDLEINITTTHVDGTRVKTSLLHSNSMLKEYSPPRLKDLFQDAGASKASIANQGTIYIRYKRTPTL